MEIHQGRCKGVSNHYLHLKPRHKCHEIEKKEGSKMCRREFGKETLGVSRPIFLTTAVSGDGDIAFCPPR